LSRREDFATGEKEKVQRALFRQEGSALVYQVAILEAVKEPYYWQEVMKAQ
jgi:hypothetical protein